MSVAVLGRMHSTTGVALTLSSCLHRCGCGGGDGYHDRAGQHCHACCVAVALPGCVSAAVPAHRHGRGASVSSALQGTSYPMPPQCSQDRSSNYLCSVSSEDLLMLKGWCQSPLFALQSLSASFLRLAVCTAFGRHRRRLNVSAGPWGGLVPAGNRSGGAVPDRHLALGRPAAAAPQPGLLRAPRGGPAARLPGARQRQVASLLTALTC